MFRISSSELVTPICQSLSGLRISKKSFSKRLLKSDSNSHNFLLLLNFRHRDTLASHIGHYDMLSFFAVAQNDSIGRVRYQLLEVVIVFVFLNRYQYFT